MAFFKVMLDDFSGNLRIPPKFARNVIGGEGWKRAELTSSTGKTWTVKVHKDVNGFHCFGEGWGDFVLAHGIRFGYFLLFLYEGGSAFHVTVFDTSQCNVRYPPVGVGIKDEDHGVGDDEGLLISRNRNGEEEEDDDDEESPSSRGRRRSRGLKNSSLSAVPTESNFKVTLKRSNFCAKQYLHVPRKFLASNDLSGVRRAVLLTPKGCWPVAFRHVRRGMYTDVLFSDGWGSFWSTNDLRLGDVCVFEMLSIEKDEVNFSVSKE